MTALEKLPEIEKPLLGEILVQRKVITPEQLKEALEIQKKEKQFLGEILVKLGYIEERDIVVALIIQYNLPYIAINKYDIDKEILKLVPAEIAREFHLIPLDRVGNVLSVVMADPLNMTVRKKLEEMTQCKVATFIATETEIDEAVARWYGPGKQK